MGARSHVSAKKFAVLGLVNFAAICAAYFIYINTQHFSEDSFEGMLDIGALANTNLRNGRFIHFLLYSALNTACPDLLMHQRLIQLILALTVALCASALSLLFAKPYPKKNYPLLAVINALILLLFINPGFQSGWFYWPETSIGASVSVATTSIAIALWCKAERSPIYLFLSFVALFVALGMYQVYLEFYLGICLTYTLLENDFKLSKQTIISALVLLTFCLVASVLNILLMNMMQSAGIIYKDGRSATLSASILISNFINIVKLQPAIWINMDGLMPYGLPLALLLFLAIPIALTRPKQLKVRDWTGIAICALLIYAASFSPLLISGTFWPAARVYVGFYCLYLFVGMLFLKAVEPDKKVMNLYFCGILSFLLVIAATLWDIQRNTISSNEMDKEEISEAQNAIKAEQNEVQIACLKICYDSATTYFYPGINYGVYDNNVRGMAYNWCAKGMFQYWKELDCDIEIATAEETARVFGDGTNWDSFDLDNQLKIEGQTAYLCIY